MVALLLALGSSGVGCLPGDWLLRLDWQPGPARLQPWRLWTAAVVHWSPQHLALNLAGAALVAALGWASRVGPRDALAWLLAWPLTQAGLWWRPDLGHFGGLSGVLHAGAIVVALQWLASGTRWRRVGGLGLSVALAGKLLHEAPWGPALQPMPGSDLMLAPWAHATGVLAGLGSAALVAVLRFSLGRADAGPAPARPPATPQCGSCRRT